MAVFSRNSDVFNVDVALHMATGLDGAVAKSSANVLVGTGIASRIFLKGPMGRCKATTPSSFSITSKRVTPNY